MTVQNNYVQCNDHVNAYLSYGELQQMDLGVNNTGLNSSCLSDRSKSVNRSLTKHQSQVMSGERIDVTVKTNLLLPLAPLLNESGIVKPEAKVSQDKAINTTSCSVRLEKEWHSRLSQEDIELSEKVRNSIVNWLLGEDRQKFENLEPKSSKILSDGLNYRYRILRQRYLFVSPTQAYKNLLNRLGCVVTLRHKIRTWIALSRDRQRAVVDVLQEVIQELLNHDRYIQSQMTWISQCTQNERLRNSLLFATIEEYCLRPIRNRPLLSYRFVTYLRRQSRGGMTQVPQQEIIRILSEEVGTDENESSVNLLDTQAISQYQEVQDWHERQTLRLKVQENFELYLHSKLGQVAVDWLRLYLAGYSQEVIASRLNLPIKQMYRLREKVIYHGIKGFALKGNPELVANWLEISLKEHNLGLTPAQWTKFWSMLSNLQQEILTLSKSGQPLEMTGKELNLNKAQIFKQWNDIYLLAQTIRNDNL